MQSFQYVSINIESAQPSTCSKFGFLALRVFDFDIPDLHKATELAGSQNRKWRRESGGFSKYSIDTVLTNEVCVQRIQRVLEEIWTTYGHKGKLKNIFYLTAFKLFKCILLERTREVFKWADSLGYVISKAGRVHYQVQIQPSSWRSAPSPFLQNMRSHNSRFKTSTWCFPGFINLRQHLNMIL